MANSYSWITYKEFGQESSWFGSGLREIGAVPKDKIGIFAETKAEWLISALGCFKNNFGLVTIYPNLGVEGLMYGFLQTNVEVIFYSFVDYVIIFLINLFLDRNNFCRIISKSTRNC